MPKLTNVRYPNGGYYYSLNGKPLGCVFVDNERSTHPDRAIRRYRWSWLRTMFSEFGHGCDRPQEAFATHREACADMLAVLVSGVSHPSSDDSTDA